MAKFFNFVKNIIMAQNGLSKEQSLELLRQRVTSANKLRKLGDSVRLTNKDLVLIGQSIFKLEEDIPSLNEEGNTNIVIVQSVNDLPAPTANIITLEENTIYEVIGDVDLGANRLVMANNVTIRSNSPAVNSLISSTSGALITADCNFRLWEIGFSATNGTIFDLNGSGSEICLCVGVRFFGTGGLGVVDQYDLFEINVGLFVGFTTGLTFTGANGSLILMDTEFFQVTGTPTSLSLGTATFNNIRFIGVAFTVIAGGTGLAVAANGANLNSGFSGILVGVTFTGAGTYTSGYSALDTAWKVNLSNSGISFSDRLFPTGWGAYIDAESSPATQSLTTAFQLLQIDGGAAASNSDYLPQHLKDSGGELWDTTNDIITPISIGDSYNLRVDLEITAKGGGVTSLYLQLDIGGGVSPSDVIVDRVISIPKTPPFTVSVGFPIYTLGTFVTNGGQFFIATDVGTATLAARGITIQRVSSGAVV